MSELNKKVVLVDLPTFPRGVISLSLPVVAAHLRESFEIVLIDLNIHSGADLKSALSGAWACGFKVSAQNHRIATEWTIEVRHQNPNLHVFWGGEFPTLLPEEAAKSSPSIVIGNFEDHALRFVEDLKKGSLQPFYREANAKPLGLNPPPALDLVEKDKYFSFMGLPVETSKGCKFKCTFCMVHTMQPEREFHARATLRRDLKLIRHSFVNVIDYNLGNDKAHLLEICEEFEKSSAWGWMGEMCIENLDDEEILSALKRSRCRIVYCGLESVDSGSLRKINKTQNNVAEYKRIIRKAQSYGIEVASGFILGLPGSTEEGFRENLAFYEEIGVLYVKFTFLTYNPGTKVYSSMKRMGEYLSDRAEDFDGNHLTFLPNGVDAKTVFAGGKLLMDRLYSLGSLLKRSRHLRWSPLKRAEFILFGYCYGYSYSLWDKFGLLEPEQNKFKDLLKEPLKKPFAFTLAESGLSVLRALRFGAKKRAEIAILTTIMAFLLTFINVAWTEEKKALPRWADASLSRHERLQSCRQCHAETYANWEKGPHAAATFQLEKYRHEVRTNPHYPEEEKNIIKRNDCINCHAPQNLFENNRLPIEYPGGPDKLFKIGDVIAVRPDNHQSGIDCLSCHAAGNRVVTRADYKPTKNLKVTSDFCDPLPSTMFSNINTCITCHVLLPEQYYEYHERHPDKRGQSCNTCHMDKRPDGSYNHYEFWARDSVEDYKRRPSQMQPYDDVELSVQKFKRGYVVTVLWKNDFSPHNVIPSGPRQNLFKIELVGPDQKVFFGHNIRFAAANSVEMGPMPEGTTNRRLLADKTLEVDYDLPKDFPKKGVIRFKVFRKVSYYLPDDDSRLIYERDIPYEIK